ncbi:MAG: DNA polymerase ligase N-terminal domain-containing protein [Nitrososphaerota archaeon]|nr:3'-phosphoesterase [Candidatus Bathyarchaeota archaeon]MCX8161656.1 3'-phosphoesterase [Candidatus Bathyarchaeota archaeon]MDW8061646.1 DNA polymerase ligase N-terminal domain-containing protein [Nitrososphaerota archaeon]
MPRFVVHEHIARRAGLHYDLRIEVNGVLKDWAFRKPLPEDVNVKRFGVAQPDHDLSWLDFEGEIEDGYGAGIIKIWDRGSCDLIEKTDKSMTLEFYGNKLRGSYMLLKFKDGWLLFKVRT